MTTESPKGTVLLVDDDPAILEAVNDLLVAYGYFVTSASDGSQALDALQTFQPDIIVSDISMPNMDGYQFFEAVRRNPEWASIPFIFLTAKGQKADVRQGYQLGADDFIVKPFDADDLLLKIDVRLRRVRAIRSSAEAAAAHTQDELLTVFGHELRTPLTYIYGYSSLLQDSHGELDEASLDQMLDGIHLGAERLVRLTEALLLMVRIDSGVAAYEVKRRSTNVDLRQIALQAVESFQPAASAADIALTVDAPKPVVVSGLEQFAQTALWNLLDNALRFCRRVNGQIGVALSSAGNAGILSVSDNGVGIAPDDQERIFDRFVQIDRTRHEQQGVGLGLAIARSITRLQGGDIQVTSQVGQGSTFRLMLPLAKR